MATTEPMMQQFSVANSIEQLQKIGAGHCGSVWSVATRARDDAFRLLVMKREDGGDGRSITHEYNMHRHIIRCLESPRGFNLTQGHLVNIPNCEGFLEQRDEAIWSCVLPRLPPNYTACNALVSEKIPPQPRHVRRLLAEKLQFGPNPDQVADNASNEHCLIRPYFGRRKRRNLEQEPRRPKFYSLRNLPLYVDQMEDLGLELDAYVCAMADTLAFLHWCAKVDANDVEFVLARNRQSTNEKNSPSLGSTSFYSKALEHHSMWVLDFDCCREMTMDVQGIQQACRSFWRNDPYYPRPGSDNPVDQRLWEVFESRFEQTSGCLLQDEDDETKQLPGQLMSLIKQTRGKFSRGIDLDFDGLAMDT